MEPTPLSQEERQEILDGIQRREALEAQAKREHQAALKAEAERTHAESLAAERRRREEERRGYILGLLQQSFGELETAIAAFQEDDETKAYRLMVRLTGNLNLAQQRLIQPSDNTPVTGSLPVVKVKRDNTPLGFAIVNLEDVKPSDQIIQQEDGADG